MGKREKSVLSLSIKLSLLLCGPAFESMQEAMVAMQAVAFWTPLKGGGGG